MLYIIKYNIITALCVKSDINKFKISVVSSLNKIETYHNKYNTHNIKYKETCYKCAHIHVFMANKNIINSIFPSKEDINLSWTDQRSNIIGICYENWKHKYIHSRKLYKHYVIMHEFLHAYPFYLGHSKKRCINNAYSIMYQQTRIAGDKKEKTKQKKKCKKKKLNLSDIKKIDITKNLFYDNNNVKINKNLILCKLNLLLL